MNLSKTANTLHRVGLSLVVGGAMVYAFGGCSMKDVGLQLLSMFMTSGGTASSGSTINSALGALVGQLLGGAT
jgi:hypothetical protein